MSLNIDTLIRDTSISEPYIDQVNIHKNDKNCLYRFEFSGGLYDTVYLIQKTTPCGDWITGTDWRSPDKPKWVNRKTIKRFAYPTKMEALWGFIKRRKRHIYLLTDRLDIAKESLDIAKTLYEAETKGD